MKPLQQLTGVDLTSQAMENDLLTHEVRFLRARLTAAERKLARLQRAGRAEARQRTKTRLMEAKARAARAEAQLKAQKTEVEGEARAAQAESDLRWLLQRLDHSLLGVVLRRKRGFRTLLERYSDVP